MIRAKIDEVLAVDRQADPAAVARLVLPSLSEADLIGLIADEVARVQRHDVRITETAAFREVWGRVPVQVVPTAAFMKMVAEKFSLGDGSAVAWGAATVEQHQHRIVMLSKIRDGIDSSIRRHREAIAQIEAAGVSCLDQIAEVA